MPAPLDRRAFLRAGALAALGAAAAACSPSRPAAPGAASPSPPTPRSPSPSPAPAAWRRLAASGPAPRRDHSLTADPASGTRYLFGGRSGGDPRGDLWAYDGGGWREIRAGGGPAPRFGHNAVALDGRLVVFGGQGGPSEFFNDVWRFDPEAGAWDEITPPGAAPAERYGAGGTVVGGGLLVSHGFTHAGRFDDTWRLGERWQDVSPAAGRPVERCLHRIALLARTGVVVLFGGQTNGAPFLDDTWLLDPAARTWREVTGEGPVARNLHAMDAAPDAVWVFGGAGADGPLADVWRFDGAAWREIVVDGEGPGPRAGLDGTVAGGRLSVFGGRGPSGELGDLWELALPEPGDG